jgi:hypothetical protein
MSDVAETARGALRALDPDLPIVAARAAVQLDAAIAIATGNARPTELRTDAIDQLAGMMTNITSSIAGPAAKSLVDPLTMNLVSRAYSDSSHASLSSFNDLQEAAQTLSKMFEKVSGGKERGAELLKMLETLRDFCIKLSEYAASKRQLAYGNRPTVSYWRLKLAS